MNWKDWLSFFGMMAAMVVLFALFVLAMFSPVLVLAWLVLEYVVK